MDKSEFYEYEDRAYINPTISSGEQEAFVDTFRNIQQQNAQQISEDTYNLGTQVPSNLGGLGGGEAYFSSRYQIPQANEMVDTLKSAAQAQVLNDIMKNYQAQLKERYNQAYRRYQKRQRKKQNTPSGPLSPSDVTKGVVNETVANTSTANPEALYQEKLRHEDAQKNTAKAKQEAAERAKNVSQALNPTLDPLASQEDLINYWSNIRR